MIINTSNKGQITIFIIIGVIILGSVAVVIVTKSILERKDISLEREQTMLLPNKIRPVKEAIDFCIREISEDALKIIGLQGGYLKIPEDKYQINPKNEFSNYLKIISNLRVPYWYYQNIAETEMQAIPSIGLIESQISEYINNNIPLCIPQAQKISKSGYTLITKTPQTDTEIRKNQNILIKIKYPMTFIVDGDNFNFDNFNQNIDLDLYNIYEAATKIIQNEINTNFLEEQTTDMMILYDKIPYDFTELSCSPKIWAVEDVKKDFKDILFVNIPLIKIKNTDYELSEASHKIFEWDSLQENFKHLNINLVYSQNWPFSLEVTPNDNGILKGRDLGKKLSSQQLGIPIGLVCLNEYHFVYDIKYPILIVINDPKAINGNGFTFQYATQVVIDKNQPRKNQFLPKFEQDQKEFCSRPGYSSRIISLVKDKNDNFINLGDTEISYKCSTATCDLGKTAIDSTGEASLTTNIPPCINGLLISKKQGFNPKEITFSSNEPGVVSFVLDKYNEKEIELKIVEPNGIRDLFESEQVIISLDSPEYKTSYLSSAGNKIKLIPGNYEVKSTIIRDSKTGIRIPGFTQERCTKVTKQGIEGLFGLEEEKCIDIKIEDIILDQIIVGGANTHLQIAKSDLIKDNKLVVYIYYNGIPTNIEELNLIQSKIETNSKNHNLKEPEFI